MSSATDARLARAASVARRWLERGISEGVFSGAQAAWIGPDRAVERVSAGVTERHGGDAVGDDTLFDIASLTKPFVASAVLRLVARGEIDLEARLDDLVPSLAGRLQGRATLAQTLAHEAGFLAWLPLFEAVPPEARGTPDGRRAVLDLAMMVPGGSPPGSRATYSDLGFMAVGLALEGRFGALDALVASKVTGPLGLRNTAFRRVGLPENEAGHRTIAATERCPWRGRVLRGEVHDDNAWTMGGVAPHAGLFSTASDVARFGAAWLDALRGADFLDRELAVAAATARPLGRGLGWDARSGDLPSSGSRMGSRTFGHLGFTGCSLWIDPDLDLAVALLTNRVHPTRANESIRVFRPAFHDALVEAL